MDTITIIGILMGLSLGIFFFFVDEALDKMFKLIFMLIGLKSSTGPIRIQASHKDHIIKLEISNQEKGRAMLGVIKGVACSGQKNFPVPFTSPAEARGGTPEKRVRELRKHFAYENIPSGSTKSFFLDEGELAGGGLNAIRLLGRNGNYWSAT